MLFTDYRTTSNEGMLATHSHLFPIQPSRASGLLPSLLGGTCAQTLGSRPILSTAVIDLLPINQARLNFTGSVDFWGYCEPYGRWLCHSFVKSGFLTTIRPVYRKIKHIGFLKSTPQSPYIYICLAVSPEMERTGKQVPPSNEGRRLDALDGWIGNRWECVEAYLCYWLFYNQ